MVLSIDRLDYTKGIAQRLLAFEQLLLRYPEWVGQVNLNYGGGALARPSAAVRGPETGD